MIRGCREAGIGPGGNVYAELGSLWHGLMRDPEQAAHALGKLLAYFGEERILWGTDCIWYGSPQAQIQAFRAFEIPEQMQQSFGYPALTPAVKRRILGLNAIEVYGLERPEVERALQWDPVARAREEYRNAPRPSHRSYGPRSRRELLAMIRFNGGLPG